MKWKINNENEKIIQTKWKPTIMKMKAIALKKIMAAIMANAKNGQLKNENQWREK